MRTFKPALTFRLLIAIFLLLPAAGLLVAAVFQPDVRTVMLSIGLAACDAGAPGCGCWPGGPS